MGGLPAAAAPLPVAAAASAAAGTSAAGAPPPTLADFKAFVAAVAAAAARDAADAAAFADPPDEFVDTILGTLMRDPVATPAGTVYERRAILECLLMKPEDPANRQPLRAEDLKELPELKARIEAWRAGKREAAAAAAADADASRSSGIHTD